jgi:hypothetical protein
VNLNPTTFYQFFTAALSFGIFWSDYSPNFFLKKSNNQRSLQKKTKEYQTNNNLRRLKS